MGVIFKGGSGIGHLDDPPDVRPNGALSDHPAQLGVNLVTIGPSKRVEPEAAHCGVEFVDPSAHDAHDREVANAGHADRPPGHAVVIVVSEPDRQIATPACSTPPRGANEVAARQVAHHISAAVAGCVKHRISKIARSVINHQIRPEPTAQRCLVLAAHCGDHLRSRRSTQLDRSSAQPTRTRMHQHRLTGT